MRVKRNNEDLSTIQTICPQCLILVNLCCIVNILTRFVEYAREMISNKIMKQIQTTFMDLHNVELVFNDTRQTISLNNLVNLIVSFNQFEWKGTLCFHVCHPFA